MWCSSVELLGHFSTSIRCFLCFLFFTACSSLLILPLLIENSPVHDSNGLNLISSCWSEMNYVHMFVLFLFQLPRTRCYLRARPFFWRTRHVAGPWLAMVTCIVIFVLFFFSSLCRSTLCFGRFCRKPYFKDDLFDLCFGVSCGHFFTQAAKAYHSFCATLL